MNLYSDQEIVGNIINSNENAFEFIFLNYYQVLCIYALSIVRDKIIAEEIVQDVFVKLWEKRADLSIKSSLKAYLYRSVHNHGLNYLKHQLVQQKFTADLLVNSSIFVSPLSPDYPLANMLSQELGDKINQSVSALPNQCREVFLLIRYDDHSYEEAAEKLNISINTVKTQLKRAISKLRESLKDYLPTIVIWVWMMF